MGLFVLFLIIISLLITIKIYFWLNNPEETNNLLYFDCTPATCLKENGFLAISVNNKSPYFVQENCDKLIKNLPQSVKLIMIADEIAHYNIQAFERKKEKIAKQRAAEMGIKLMYLFKESIDKFHSTVKLCRWEDLHLNLDNCVTRLEKCSNLNTRVVNLANNFVAYRGQNKSDKSFDTKIELAKKYIYHELPVIICGVTYDGDWYRMLYYSGNIAHLKKFTGEDSLHNLAQNIKYANEYVNVRNIIMEEMMMPGIACSGFAGMVIEEMD